MATDLRKGVFSQILLKTTENDQTFERLSKFQNAKALKLLGIIHHFMYFSEK